MQMGSIRDHLFERPKLLKSKTFKRIKGFITTLKIVNTCKIYLLT